MFQENEFPTIIFLLKDISFAQTDCNELDNYYTFKKVEFTKKKMLFDFLEKSNPQVNNWNGTYLLHIPINLYHSITTDIFKNILIVPVLSFSASAYSAHDWHNYNDKLLFEVQFDLLKTQLPELIKLILSIPKKINILLQPSFFGNAEKLIKYIYKLNDLYSQLAKFENDNILFPSGIFKRDVLLKHPCNAYACNGKSCHSNKSGKPRNIFIHSDGSVTPESRILVNKYVIYNTKVSPPFVNFNKDGMTNFTTDMIWLFENFVIGSEYDVIPINTIIPFINNLKEIMP